MAKKIVLIFPHLFSSNRLGICRIQAVLQPRLPKLPRSFELHRLGNLGSLNSNKEMQSQYITELYKEMHSAILTEHCQPIHCQCDIRSLLDFCVFHRELSIQTLLPKIIKLSNVL